MRREKISLSRRKKAQNPRNGERNIVQALDMALAPKRTQLYKWPEVQETSKRRKKKLNGTIFCLFVWGGGRGLATPHTMWDTSSPTRD